MFKGYFVTLDKSCCYCGNHRGYIGTIGVDDNDRPYYGVYCYDCDAFICDIYDDDVVDQSTVDNMGDVIV